MVLFRFGVLFTSQVFLIFTQAFSFVIFELSGKVASDNHRCVVTLW